MSENASILTPRKIALQLVGFTIGLGLLVWCIRIAFGDADVDDWKRIFDAKNRWLLLGLLGCSLLSQFVNGASFWLILRPVKVLRFDHMQWLNLVSGLLNYAPIRAGALARIAYHLRVDRLTLLQIGAMFAALAFTVVLTLGACFAATLLRPQFDLVWGGLVLLLVILGGLMISALMGQPVITRYAQGMDQMLRRPECLWGAIGLRLADIGAYVGRMACAAAILGLSLSATEILLLGLAALVVGLNPLGRVGFREIMVTWVASRMVSADLSATELDASMGQLAIIESAGEVLVFVPLGAMALFWYRKRWIAARRVEHSDAPE